MVFKNSPRWAGIFLTKRPPDGKIYVSYGINHIPCQNEIAYGGMIKYQLLQNVFPNSPFRFNIQYIVSSVTPRDWSQILWLKERKKVRLVWNQNGVWYKACYGPGYEKVNYPMKRMLHAADYVFYQSRFCKLSADHFLGERKDSWEILYNPVDTKFFKPNDSDPDPKKIILLLGGNQFPYSRFEHAVRILSLLIKYHSNVQLIVTGKLGSLPQKEAIQNSLHFAKRLGVSDHIVFLGPYLYKDAPDIYRKSHILIHTKYNDPCPTVVQEAMACGIPVVYSNSGGVPELVGDEAGIGIPARLTWEEELPPDSQAMAEAVLRIYDERTRYGEAARERAVKYFDLQPWLKRHKEVFEELLCR